MTNIVLVNEEDTVLGFKEKFAAHKNPVPLHRAVSIVIYDRRGRMLITKRATSKPT